MYRGVQIWLRKTEWRRLSGSINMQRCRISYRLAKKKKKRQNNRHIFHFQAGFSLFDKISSTDLVKLLTNPTRNKETIITHERFRQMCLLLAQEDRNQTTKEEGSKDEDRQEGADNYKKWEASAFPQISSVLVTDLTSSCSLIPPLFGNLFKDAGRYDKGRNRDIKLLDKKTVVAGEADSNRGFKPTPNSLVNRFKCNNMLPPISQVSRFNGEPRRD